MVWKLLRAAARIMQDTFSQSQFPVIAQPISLLLRAGSENRVRGIQKEVVECMADVVAFGLAVLHVAVTRLMILAREVNRDGHSNVKVFF